MASVYERFRLKILENPGGDEPASRLRGVRSWLDTGKMATRNPKANHLGCKKNLVNIGWYWDNLYINCCRISFINSMLRSWNRTKLLTARPVAAGRRCQRDLRRIWPRALVTQTPTNWYPEKWKKTGPNGCQTGYFVGDDIQSPVITGDYLRTKL